MKEAKSLGDYLIIKKLGQGALGAVFLAEHRYLKKMYALKVLPEELSSNLSFMHRFEKEIGELALLDHPSIVKVHNVSYDQGLYYIVSDCIVDDLQETTNLAQHIIAQKTVWTEGALIRLLRQLADALDYAHSRVLFGESVAHLGIKLNNVLVKKGKEGVDFALSDFGLTRIVGAGFLLTRTYQNVSAALGVHIGGENFSYEKNVLVPLHASFLQSYAFLAPEQKRLDSLEAPSKQSDVYAFGVLAYYLLMQSFPEGIFEMPSERHTSFLWDWDSLIKSCLQKDPAKRPKRLMDVLNTMLDKGENKEVALSYQLDQISQRKREEKESFAYAEKTSSYAATQEIKHVVNPFLKPILKEKMIEKPDVSFDPLSLLEVDKTVRAFLPTEIEQDISIEPLLTEMSIIPGGNFFRGSSGGSRDENPRHEITLSTFALDIHPVTNEQFVRFLEVMGGEKDTNHHDIIRLKESRIKRINGKLCIESGYMKHPVVGVTWYGAVAYAKWVGKRLPTEAEWEIAAAGGALCSLYPTGKNIEKPDANFFSSDTTAVKSYPPTFFNLYDLAGNVYEWCQDWYSYNYYEYSSQEPVDPQGPPQGVYRVLRGGCWKSLKEDLRAARRHRNNPGTVNGTYGFRCAADVG